MKKTTTLLFVLLTLSAFCMQGMSQQSPAGPKPAALESTATAESPAEASTRPETAVRQNAQSVQSNISNRQQTRQYNQRDRRQDRRIAKKNLETGTKETGEAAIRYKTRQNNQQTRKANEAAAVEHARAIQKNVNFRQTRRTDVETVKDFHEAHPAAR